MANQKRNTRTRRPAQPPRTPPWLRPSVHLTNLRSLTGASCVDTQILDPSTGEYADKTEAEIRDDPEEWAELDEGEQRRVLGQIGMAQAKLLDDLRRIMLRQNAYMRSEQKARIVAERDDDDDDDEGEDDEDEPAPRRRRPAQSKRPAQRRTRPSADAASGDDDDDDLSNIDYDPDDDPEAPGGSIAAPLSPAQIQAIVEKARAASAPAENEADDEASGVDPTDVIDADSTPVPAPRKRKSRAKPKSQPTADAG